MVVLENEGGTGREPCVVGENGERVNCDDTIEVRYDLLWNSNIATYGKQTVGLVLFYSIFMLFIFFF